MSSLKDNPSPALSRLQKDIKDFAAVKSTSIHIHRDVDLPMIVHALIRGPEGTPYHNGFFYFLLRFPEDYPYRPPRVKLLTTGAKTVKFHPCFGIDGSVNIPVLSPDKRDGWTAGQTLLSVLQTIQSVMKEIPINDFANFKTMDKNEVLLEYYANITYDTIRVAVFDIINDRTETKSMPQALKDVVFAFFICNFSFYEELIRSHIKYVDIPEDYSTPFGDLMAELLNMKSLYRIEDLMESDATEESASDQSSCVSETSVPEESPLLSDCNPFLRRMTDKKEVALDLNDNETAAEDQDN